MRRLLAYLITILVLITILAPTCLSEELADDVDVIDEISIESNETTIDASIAEAASAEFTEESIDEIIVDAAEIAVMDDETIVPDDAALVGVIERVATAPTLDITPFDNGYVIVKNASAYPRLYARVAWRFIDLTGEGMLIVSTSFVDTDTGEVEIVKPQVSGTFDYCQIIITDTRRPSTKRPAQVNRIISQTIKAKVPPVQM